MQLPSVCRLVGATMIASGLSLAAIGSAEASLLKPYSSESSAQLPLDSSAQVDPFRTGAEAGRGPLKGWSAQSIAGVDSAGDNVVGKYDAFTDLRQILFSETFVPGALQFMPNLGKAASAVGKTGGLSWIFGSSFDHAALVDTSVAVVEAAVTTLPEPGTLAIMSSGVAGVIVARWWERRSGSRRHRRPLKTAVSAAQYRWLTVSARYGNE